MRVAGRVPPGFGTREQELIRVFALPHSKELWNARHLFHAPFAPLGNPAEPVAVRALPDFHVAVVPLLVGVKPD